MGSGQESCSPGSTIGQRLPLEEIPQVLARLEPDRLAGWDPNFVAGARVPSDSFLPGFDLEDAEPAQLDRSPRFIATFIASRTASTAEIERTLVMSATVETLLMMSALIMT